MIAPFAGTVADAGPTRHLDRQVRIVLVQTLAAFAGTLSRAVLAASAAAAQATRRKR